MRVAAFTGGLNVPSARFRVRQYIPYLADLGVELDEFYAYYGCYPPQNKYIRPFWGFSSLTERIPAIIKSHVYDLCFIQRPFISKYITLESFTNKKRILDVDDAIWLQLGEFQSRMLSESCDAIICGNSFLAENFAQWNKNITVIPTGIDVNRFFPLVNYQQDPVIIGWMGTRRNLAELEKIEPALATICQKYKNVKIRVVSNHSPHLPLIPSEQLDYIPWASVTEVKLLQDLTIGIMPLTENSIWNRGKCSFKMLTYMACGVPVIVSPIGMNEEVLNLGNCGLSAKNIAEWVDNFDYLINNLHIAQEMGKIGRKIIVDYFSLEILSARLAQVMAMSNFDKK